VARAVVPPAHRTAVKGTLPEDGHRFDSHLSAGRRAEAGTAEAARLHGQSGVFAPHMGTLHSRHWKSAYRRDPPRGAKIGIENGPTPSDLRVTEDGPRSGPNAIIRPPCFAQTVVASHFNATPANMPTRAVQGRRRYARTRHRSSIPTMSCPPPTFSGGGSWAEPFLKTAHRRIPAEPVRFRASPSCFRLQPLVPGLFWFRARVILLSDGPTRPIPQLPVRGKVPTFPHPEPPRLLVLPGEWANHDSPLRSPVLGRMTTFVQQLKRGNTPRARNSLFLGTQGVARPSGVVRAQNSGTIRATRPLGRGTV
jgi:hypothetical protein